MKHVYGIICCCVLMAVLSVVARADSSLNFSIPDKGGISVESGGQASSLMIGSARIQSTGSSAPAGGAVFGFRQNDILVSEAGVPVTTPISSGRFFAHVAGSVNTGVAIANPNAQSVTVSFFFTGLAGNDFGSGTIQIPGNGQIAKFLNEDPF